MSYEIIISQEVREAFQGWVKTKMKGWNMKTTGYKIEALKELIFNILGEVEIQEASFYGSHKNKPLIYIDVKKPSIISTLHEIGHQIYGSSELYACAFSYTLYNDYLPNELSKLVWEGHLLKKPKKA